jgi:hypothetical protein
MVDCENGFPEHCGGPFELTSAHAITSWASKPTTLAEMAIIFYLTSQPSRYADKSVLHVGVGNSSLYSALQAHLSNYVGLTINLPEVEGFQTRFPRAQNATVLVVNKHDPRSYSEIPGNFDLIIDVNLKSYACCQTHFESMMRFYVTRLRPGGQLMTAETGLVHGWSATKGAYTPGADTNPKATQHRVLGVDGLKHFADEHRMSVTSVRVRDISHQHGAAQGEHLISDETIWLLKRA